ncbi:MFS transporter [Streptomyces orinoci]|uniref:MFS transporter n=2 Tax=Streptomyces orinoci TaxID=67339 RepID=A0ABV3K2P8_STRON|nr:MFS transporter [Streptomyces orinoci]
MDVSVLYFAVPFISRDLHPTAAQQLWIFDIYGFVLSGLLLTMGALGDRIGRRRLLLLGAAAFGTASAAAAYAHNAETLIALRALLGVGGATLMPSTLALVRNLFPDERQRGTAVAVWSGTLTGGVALGPVLSGFLLNHFWWGSVFLVNLPAMALLLILAPLLVPEFKDSSPGHRFDLLGSALSLAATLPTVYGIKRIAADGFTAPPTLAIVAGLAFGAAFVQRQRTAEHPMVNPALFHRRGFGPAIALNAAAMFALAGFSVFSTQYLQLVLGKSALEAALWSLAPSALVGCAAPVATALSQRGVDRAYIVGGAFALAALGYATALGVTAGSGIWLVLLACGVVAAGIVMVMTQNTDLALSTVPPQGAGAASALLETGQEFGAALGTAVLGSLGAAVYRREVTDSAPAALPDGALHSVRQTLGNALTVADRLPSQARPALVHAARTAFVQGMHAAAIGALAVMLLASGFVLTRLRGLASAPSPAIPAEEPAIMPETAGVR